MRLLALLVSLAALAAAPAPAAAANNLDVGLYDEASTLFAADTQGFDRLQELGIDVLRLNLYWDHVATTRPSSPADPGDPAYDWSLYDRAVSLAAERDIRLLLAVIATPGWANGGKGAKYAPTNFSDLQAFSRAAATRYSGNYVPVPRTPSGNTAPPGKVDLWLAWSEPNAPTSSSRSSARSATATSSQARPSMRRSATPSIAASTRPAKRPALSETVACGATNPRGKIRGNGNRDSVSPLLFLEKMKAAGAQFDAYAHHPYSPSRHIAPGERIASVRTVTLGNIDLLVASLTRLYGKSMRLWITEYGYQTNPPDPFFGVSWAKQATYLRQAYAIAPTNPRIDMMLWFLLQDEVDVGRWQSGLISASGQRKPSFGALRGVAGG